MPISQWDARSVHSSSAAAHGTADRVGVDLASRWHRLKAQPRPQRAWAAGRLPSGGPRPASGMCGTDVSSLAITSLQACNRHAGPAAGATLRHPQSGSPPLAIDRGPSPRPAARIDRFLAGPSDGALMERRRTGMRHPVTARPLGGTDVLM